MLFAVYFLKLFLSLLFFLYKNNFFVFNVHCLMCKIMFLYAFVAKIFKNKKCAFGLTVIKIDKGSKNNRNHSFSTFAKFSEKLTFFTP